MNTQHFQAVLKNLHSDSITVFHNVRDTFDRNEDKNESKGEISNDAGSFVYLASFRLLYNDVFLIRKNLRKT